MLQPMEIARKPYPSDVSDDEWTLIAPYLTLLPEDAGQRDYPLREAFNGLRYIIKTGAQLRAMPHDLPPWAAVYQQARRWLNWGCFEALLDDLRSVLREALGRSADPSAIIIDARTLRSSPESGPAMTGASARGARSCILRSIPWATCWLCASPRRMSTTGRRSAH